MAKVDQRSRVEASIYRLYQPDGVRAKIRAPHPRLGSPRGRVGGADDCGAAVGTL